MHKLEHMRCGNERTFVFGARRNLVSRRRTNAKPIEKDIYFKSDNDK
jgi:hypothetical protein